MAKTSITILCVNYHSDEFLQRYLQSIEAARKRVIDRANVQVFVANNDQVNRGYFGGIKFLLETCSISEGYVIISNVDLIVSADFFERLLTIQLPSSVKCIAPSIQSISEHQERNPEYASRPSRKHIYWASKQFISPFVHWLYLKLCYQRRSIKQTPLRPTPIYAAHGSFLIFTSKQIVYSLIPSFQPFLYGEELYIAESLRKLKYQTWFYPMLKVTDYDHVSTSKMPSRFLCKCHREGLNFVLKYFDK